ncbi:MAG: ABC transporter permease, partial [Clostridia bacterium]|nr:ABC transporter permease [Clostridia bacterium]
MKSFFASIYKDICLFLSVSGIMSLLLPALVAAAFFLGMCDASDVEVAVEPFAVAVIDLDETMMSRTLLTQFREVDLLSEVRIYHTAQLGASADGKKQQIAFDENNVLIPSDGLFDDPRFQDCAAVITVPKDFFYDAYTGDEGPVHLVLNGRMPLESALTENMITSVMGILKSERAAWYSAYSLKAGGEFDTADFAEFCSRSSDSIIASALTRRELLAASGTDEALAGNTKNTFFTCAASMLMLFVSAGVLKTLPDERRLGLADRFFSIGGKPISLILSKLTAAAVFCAAGLI